MQITSSVGVIVGTLLTLPPHSSPFVDLAKNPNGCEPCVHGVASLDRLRFRRHRRELPHRLEDAQAVTVYWNPVNVRGVDIYKEVRLCPGRSIQLVRDRVHGEPLR